MAGVAGAGFVSVGLEPFHPGAIDKVADRANADAESESAEQESASMLVTWQNVQSVIGKQFLLTGSGGCWGKRWRRWRRWR